MYVAVTRAKERLYITHAKDRIMYGRHGLGRLSTFVRDELPEELIYRDGPKRIPPRVGTSYSPSQQRVSTHRYEAPREMSRAPDIFNTPKPKSGAASYGVVRYAPGTRVNHTMFGNGIIVSARDMGGDVLYEVSFDSGVTKKLMATFAKLTKI